MITLDKVFNSTIEDPNVQHVCNRKGRKYTAYHYRKGILHIVVMRDNTTSEIVSIKLIKIY